MAGCIGTIRTGQIISGIRSIVKKESHQAVQLDLNEVVTEVLALAGGEIRRNQVVVQSELSTNLPRVSAVRVQLQQVILNLIVNAVQAMETVVGRTRSLSVRSKMRGTKEVVLTVEDSGVGITAENANRKAKRDGAVEMSVDYRSARRHSIRCSDAALRINISSH
jgi:C4-dicarboxylate-specific signal transduction histidine kinase